MSVIVCVADSIQPTHHELYNNIVLVIVTSYGLCSGSMSFDYILVTNYPKSKNTSLSRIHMIPKLVLYPHYVSCIASALRNLIQCVYFIHLRNLKQLKTSVLYSLLCT